jgi:hypothetical protein
MSKTSHMINFDIPNNPMITLIALDELDVPKRGRLILSLTLMKSLPGPLKSRVVGN